MMNDYNEFNEYWKSVKNDFTDSKSIASIARVASIMAWNSALLKVIELLQDRQENQIIPEVKDMML